MNLIRLAYIVLSLLAISCLLTVVGCSHIETEFSQARHDPQGIVELPLSSRPNMTYNVEASENYIEPLDADSVELSEYRGIIYYQPVVLSHRCFVFIGTYYHTKEKKYLDRAEKYARKLMSECHIVDGAAYVPYTVWFAVHGDSSVLLIPPWYSAMAQGELLEVVVRLYELTDDPDYLEFSHMLFRSFLRLRGTSDPWVVRIDDDGYYWLEEYPHDTKPGMTLNGFIAGLFGVYDYYQITHSESAKLVWELSLTTLKHYLPDYRRPGQTGYYCLGHRHPATEYYHGFHSILCERLYKLSGDPFFQQMAAEFRLDSGDANSALDRQHPDHSIPLLRYSGVTAEDRSRGCPDGR